MQNSYKPYKKGHFPVSDGHQLYFELWGNPKGIPIISFHGGPGSGFEDKHKRFFDPKAYNVLLFDQRGAGRSKPFASIKANTTQKLVEDTEKLMGHVGFKKALMFGGSWGSTLALVFAIKNPHLATGLILRGTFLANKHDTRHYTQGGIKNHFPEIWHRFESLVPPKHRKNISSYYLEQMQSDDPQIKEKYTYEWAYYECSLLKMHSSKKEIQATLKEFSYKSLAPLEAHYMVNNCFLEEDFILKNASKLSHLPVSIIHGRYDFICPPQNSYRLHKKIKGSKLHFVKAAHSASEKPIEKKLTAELKRFEKILK